MEVKNYNKAPKTAVVAIKFETVNEVVSHDVEELQMRLNEAKEKGTKLYHFSANCFDGRSQKTVVGRFFGIPGEEPGRVLFALLGNMGMITSGYFISEYTGGEVHSATEKKPSMEEIIAMSAEEAKTIFGDHADAAAEKGIHMVPENELPAVQSKSADDAVEAALRKLRSRGN